MRTTFFFFAMLASMAASATVTVTPLSTNYSTQKITFRVSWTGSAANNRVWVWVDLCPIAGTSPGTFAKAVISNPSATAGSIATVTGNTRGFYVTTNPSTVTATLSNATGQFNWCVYGSDAPPKVTANNGTYTLYGTQPFTLIAANGTTTQTVAATTIATSAVTITPVTITDQTGYPGVFCIYTGSDLYIDATHLCQQRTSGAKNWEVWIKDSRDSEIYRIVQYSDGVWWWAEDYRGTYGYQITCSGIRLYSATNKSQTCPAGWQLPTRAEINARFVVPPTSDNWGGPITQLNACYANSIGRCTNSPGRCDIIVSDYTTAHVARCTYNDDINLDNYVPGKVRCIRQL